MTSIGEDDVRDGEEGGVEVRSVLRPQPDVEVAVAIVHVVVQEAWFGDANTDHGGANGCDNGDEACDA